MKRNIQLETLNLERTYKVVVHVHKVKKGAGFY